MKKTMSILGLIAGLGLSAVALEKPNIIIFYVDDLGWQDVEKLNDLGDPCPYETPNLLKLADRGMSFSQGYSPAPTCAPSRAGIITGQHPAKLRYTHVTGASIPKPGKDQEFQEPFLGAYLDLDHMTLADAMKLNGYRTGHFGKWHNGLNASAFGFESVNQTRGIHRGMGDRTKDFATADDRKYPLSKEKYPPFSKDFPEGISYPYDELTEEALKFVQDHKEEPFFLNLCHWMVHWPMLTRNGELLEYYCKKLGQPFPPAKGAMTRPGQQNPYFASMVTSVDWSLGRLMELLKTTDDPRNPGKKLIETTYVFFTSDNGGAEIKGKEILSDNYPLKAGKKHTDEGGIRVPMVITGPGIPAGTECAAMINQLDFFPTILTLTSSTIPKAAYAELSGLDITPVLNGKAADVFDAEGHKRESLFWHFPHNAQRAAIRKGDYKLYRHFQTGTYSLFRLYNNGAYADIEEQEDLSANPEYAGVLQELSEELNRNLVENHAELPHRNPAFKGATLPSAKIRSVTFRKGDGNALLQLDPQSVKAAEAYILYYPEEGAAGGEHAKGEDFSHGDPAIGFRVKIPAQIRAGGYEVSAPVPAGVARVQFMVVDENRYGHYSAVTKAR
ncbi:sulfatase [Pontiella sp.]|uniref:sulfatase n=1 Tax=Pontiella sp. TaxID=2837462 RepID=UPI003561DAB9